ncbi:trypsin alpha-3-like [Topomyia yanbarensis]|uniref:trypsin alpha-3-like n=1 Tax=Topomyia yanbarensis TaxID=2498891 RepID=UPI00273BA672|nr:trypsin alpha-3-like [Topomyia yanbarensis]
MKSTFAILLLALVASNSYALNRDDYDPFEPFIAGGTNAVLGQFPSIVAVGVPTPANAFCGGVILNANHVLTAALCVLTPQNTLLAPAQVTIMSGALQLIFTAPRIGVSAIYVHPGYNPFTFANNLAVLRTTSNFVPPEIAAPNLAFAILGDEIPFDGLACQAAGWNNATATPTQQFIAAPIMNRDTCAALAVHFGRIEESMVCAGVITQGPGVCASNMGTGLFCDGRVVGILSTGFGCGTANNPGVYTQLRFYLPWLQQQYQRQDIPPAGSSPIPTW